MSNPTPCICSSGPAARWFCKAPEHDWERQRKKIAILRALEKSPGALGAAARGLADDLEGKER